MSVNQSRWNATTDSTMVGAAQTASAPLALRLRPRNITCSTGWSAASSAKIHNDQRFDSLQQN